MAKRNLDEMVKDYRGKVIRSVNPLVNPPIEEDFTLGLVCLISCWGTASDGSDNALPLKDKLDLYELGAKCVPGGIVDFTAAEISKLKDRVAKIFISIQTIGTVHALLGREWEAPILPLQAQQSDPSPTPLSMENYR